MSLEKFEESLEGSWQVVDSLTFDDGSQTWGTSKGGSPAGILANLAIETTVK